MVALEAEIGCHGAEDLTTEDGCAFVGPARWV
jgi:hypothetical protein